MTQNINLLTELSIQPVSALNSRLMGQTAIIWTLLLVLLYVTTTTINSSKERTLTLMEMTQRDLLAKIQNYNAQLAPYAEESYLDLKSLALNSTGSRGFYNYLKDLAMLTPHGVWLDRLSISEIDDTVAIEGNTVASSGVSALLDSLAKSSSFRNRKLDTVQLEKTQDSNNIHFTVSNVAGTTTTPTTNKTP